MTERYYANKEEAVESVDVGIRDTSLLNTEVAGVEDDIRTLKSTFGRLEPKIDRLKKKMSEFEHSLPDIIKVGNEENIVTDVIKVLTTTRSITRPHMAKNVLQSKAVIDCYNSRADIGEEDHIKLFPCTPMADKDPHQKVDHVADEEVLGIGDLKVKNKNDCFPSMRNHSTMDAKLLEFLFGKGANNHPRTEVARYGDIVVSNEDLQCLKPTFPLLHKVIDISAAYLYEEDSKSWFFPTSFGEQACSSHAPLNSHALIASTILLCGLQRFHRRLERCSEIFIPLHDEIEGHWFVLVMKLNAKYAEMWDSLPDIESSIRRFEKARAAMLLLQTIFEHDMTTSDDVYYHFPSFRVIVPNNNPTDGNKYDSGIYIIRHMQCYGEKWFEEFNSCDMRTMLVLEIINNPKNELLKSVSAAAVGRKKRNDCGQGLSTSNRPLTSTTDHAIDCEKLMSNIMVMPPTGRKFRSHRKRRDACDT